MSAPEGRVVVERDGAVTRITFDNTKAHNALTQAMWLAMRDAARAVADDRTTRVVVFRGAGGKAFVSGTDIGNFAGFTGERGIDYEHRMDECMAAVDAIPCTTVAVVDGWAIGGGLNIASACDFRIATPDARFGSPIGRTLGNCLSASTVSRIGAAVGVAVAKRMVLLGEIVGAEELRASGYLYAVAERDAIDAVVDALVARAAENAPLTTWATKETLRRIRQGTLPPVEDIVERVYGSRDFATGVANFLARNKTVPTWSGD